RPNTPPAWGEAPGSQLAAMLLSIFLSAPVEFLLVAFEELTHSPPNQLREARFPEEARRLFRLAHQGLGDPDVDELLLALENLRSTYLSSALHPQGILSCSRRLSYPLDTSYALRYLQSICNWYSHNRGRSMRTALYARVSTSDQSTSMQ